MASQNLDCGAGWPEDCHRLGVSPRYGATSVMQFGVCYQLPCAPGQSVPQRYRETFEQIVYADQLGFDSV